MHLYEQNTKGKNSKEWYALVHAIRFQLHARNYYFVDLVSLATTLIEHQKRLSWRTRPRLLNWHFIKSFYPGILCSSEIGKWENTDSRPGSTWPSLLTSPGHVKDNSACLRYCLHIDLVCQPLYPCADSVKTSSIPRVFLYLRARLYVHGCVCVYVRGCEWGRDRPGNTISSFTYFSKN